MRRPPILEEVTLVPSEQGIYTFSNGTEWECWANDNCFSCKWYDNECAGGACAFEGAALLGQVSPELAERFGWVQNKKWDKPNDHRHGWHAPEQCPFFKNKDDDSPDPPVIDPTQLTFLAPDGFPNVLPEPLAVGDA